MPSGGKRPGAGRPRKPLCEKIIDGKSGGHEIKTLQFPSKSKQNITRKSDSKFLSKMDDLNISMKQALPSTADICLEIEDFIESAGVLHLVPPNLIEDFAMLRRNFLECEYINRLEGRAIDGKASPYVAIGNDYQKLMMNVFAHIWTIIQNNCEREHGTQNEFLEWIVGRQNG